MIADLKPYPAYKDSGVPWLGELPEHWEVRRMKLLLHEVDSRSSSGEEQLLRVSQYTGVTQRKAIDGSDEPNTRASSLVGYKRVAANDLIVNIMLAWNGSMGVSRYDGIASPAYCVYRFRSGVRPWYYHELLRLPVYKGRIKTASTGVVESRLRLYSDDLGRIEAILPPCEEQDAIIRFLDHADRRIKRYISTKLKLVKLLEEQKQAIIYRAVTRGLDPNVRLKPSGVEWLGEVPEHWEVRRAKDLFREVDLRSTTGTEVLLSLRMYRGLVPHHEVSIIPITASALIGFKKVAPGQIVMNRMRAAIGMFGVVPQSGLVSPDYAVLEPGELVEASYFILLFKTRAASTVFRVESKGLGTGSSGFMRLYTDRFGIIKLPVPTRDEQKTIVQGIAARTAELGHTLDQIIREISLLREYRTRLIADVVTGKLDVREAAAKLPEETDEPEPLDDAEALVDGDEETEGADLDAVTEEAEV